MADQALMALALPHGLSVVGPRVSIFLAPRLTDGRNLREFPDWRNWTDRLRTGGLRVVLRCGNNRVSTHADLSGLRPDLWAAIFPPDVPVNGFHAEDYSQRLIVSYP